MIDRDIKWNINSVGRRTNPLWGSLPRSHDKAWECSRGASMSLCLRTLPYPIILGIPFITELRMETMVLDNGTHMAKVKSKYDLRRIQFPTL